MRTLGIAFIALIAQPALAASTPGEVFSSVKQLEAEFRDCLKACTTLPQQIACAEAAVNKSAALNDVVMRDFEASLRQEPSGWASVPKYQESQKLWTQYRSALCVVQSKLTVDDDYSKLQKLLCKFKSTNARWRELYNYDY